MIVRAAETGEGKGHLAAAEDGLAGLSKYRIKSFIEFILTHSCNERIRILRHEEGVLHRIAFLETSPRLIRVEIVNPFTARHSRPDKFEVIVEKLSPSVREFHQLTIVVLMTELLGKLCSSISAETVLESM